MGAAGLGIMLAAGAAFVALWIDVRWVERRPESPMRRMGHSFAAYGVVQLAAVATVHLGGDGTPLVQRVAVLFLLFGRLRSGQITLRRLVGWQALPNQKSQAEAA